MALTLDVFKQDAFNMINMTAALELMPYREMRLGQLGLYDFTEGVETDVVSIDETEGQLQILTSRPRGAEPERAVKDKKAKSRAVRIPHFQFEDRIKAATLLGKREPGTTELQSIARKIAQKQETMRQDIESTWETHRLNALRGVLLDGDGSVLEDFFELFNVSQLTHNIALSNASTNVRSRIVAGVRAIEEELGGAPYTRMHAICSAGFFDALVEHPKVRDTYQLAQANALREDLRAGFTFGGVTFEEYRGMSNLPNNLGTVAANEAIMFPVGVPRMLRAYWAPGDFVESVGTLGTPMVSKVAVDEKYNRWVDILAETNPLFINTRPRAVAKVTLS